MVKKEDNIVEVLIVDDEPEEKGYIKDLLEKLGYTVYWSTCWNDVEDFLSIRAKSSLGSPDIVFTDIHFYKLNLGSDMTREGLLIIKAIPEFCELVSLSPPPVIAFTNKIEDIDRKEVVSAGAYDLIEKSVCKNRERFSIKILQCVEEAETLQVISNIQNKQSRSMDPVFIKNALQYTEGNISKASEILGLTVSEFQDVIAGAGGVCE